MSNFYFQIQFKFSISILNFFTFNFIFSFQLSIFISDFQLQFSISFEIDLPESQLNYNYCLNKKFLGFIEASVGVFPFHSTNLLALLLAFHRSVSWSQGTHWSHSLFVVCLPAIEEHKRSSYSILGLHGLDDPKVFGIDPNSG